MTYQFSPRRANGVRRQRLSRAFPERVVAAGSARATKRVFDILFAVTALLVLAPAFLLLSVIILLANGRPVFYAHPRVGRQGRVFACWKFRTMVRDADARLTAALAQDPALRLEWQTHRKLTRDPRVTWLGYLLRRSSLDELPQFWSVLVGDMSIVGPRPVTREELSYYGADARAYASVRPGITGAWQVSGRSNTTYAERVAIDVDYVSSHSLWGDVRIVFKTVGVVLGQVGAR